MEDLPRSARLVCWFNAWIAGSAAPDDLADDVFGNDPAHDVIGLGGEDAHGLQPLLLAAGALRRRGASAAALALPVPGDPVGLAGPRAFSEAAIDVGEAAIFVGAATGLVPTTVGAGVVWAAQPAEPPGPLDVAETERALREVLAATTVLFSDLDRERWRPELADTLATTRSQRPRVLPTTYSTRAARLADMALRCRSIANLDLAFPQDERVVGALRQLERSARHALVAAISETAQQRTSAAPR